MDLIFGFTIFIGAMIFCIAKGYTMVIALFVGLIAFIIVGIRKGFTFRELMNMGKDGLKDAIVVVEVMFIIGFITAVWRSAGTITFCLLWYQSDHSRVVFDYHLCLELPVILCPGHVVRRSGHCRGHLYRLGPQRGR